MLVYFPLRQVLGDDLASLQNTLGLCSMMRNTVGAVHFRIWSKRRPLLETIIVPFVRDSAR